MDMDQFILSRNIIPFTQQTNFCFATVPSKKTWCSFGCRRLEGDQSIYGARESKGFIRASCGRPTAEAAWSIQLNINHNTMQI